MTPTDIRTAIAADPALVALAAARRDADIAAAPVFADHRAVQEYWLTDRGLVADLVMATGDTAMSDAVLTKLDGLAQQSRSIVAVVNRLTNDPRGINWGDPAMRGQIVALTPTVFTEAERDALLALAYRPAPVTVEQISNALNEVAV